MTQKVGSALILLLLLLLAVAIYYGIENNVDKRVAQAGGEKGPTIEALWRLDLFAFVLALAGVAIHEIVTLYRAIKSSSSHVSPLHVFIQSLAPLGVLAVTVLLVQALRAVVPHGV